MYLDVPIRIPKKKLEIRAKSISNLSQLDTSASKAFPCPTPQNFTKEKLNPTKKLPLISQTPTKLRLNNSLPSSNLISTSLVLPRKGSQPALLQPNPSYSNKNFANIKLNNIKNRMKKKIHEIQQVVTQAENKASVQTHEDYLNQTLASLKFIKTLPIIDINLIKQKRFSVPFRKGYEKKKTVIFDLDETLVHCTYTTDKGKNVIQIALPNGKICDAQLNVRPFVNECLKELSKDFEIFIFTASHSCYADSVCDFLDPKGEYIHQRFYRQHCIFNEGVYVKDLRIFQNRKLKNVVIVDNTLHCVPYQLDNCVPIISWYENEKDQELLKILGYIRNLIEVEDVRVANKHNFNLSGY